MTSPLMATETPNPVPLSDEVSVAVCVIFDQPLAGFTNTSTVPKSSTLASKSPTTTVSPLIAMEMPNQSFFARVLGVSSASCCQLAGTVFEKAEVALKTRIEITSSLRIGSPL